jgi:maltose O-acetyltransferase
VDGRTQKERLEAGELYVADDSVLQEELRRAARLTKAFNDSPPDDVEGRRLLLQELLGSLGDGAEIRPPLYCDYGYRLHVGSRTFVNFGLVALDVATISIGEDVQVGPNVQLLTATHRSSRSRGGPSGRQPNPSRSGTTRGSAAASSSAPA